MATVNLNVDEALKKLKELDKALVDLSKSEEQASKPIIVDVSKNYKDTSALLKDISTQIKEIQKPIKLNADISNLREQINKLSTNDILKTSKLKIPVAAEIKTVKGDVKPIRETRSIDTNKGKFESYAQIQAKKDADTIIKTTEKFVQSLNSAIESAQNKAQSLIKNSSAIKEQPKKFIGRNLSSTTATAAMEARYIDAFNNKKFLLDKKSIDFNMYSRGTPLDIDKRVQEILTSQLPIYSNNQKKRNNQQIHKFMENHPIGFVQNEYDVLRENYVKKEMEALAKAEMQSYQNWLKSRNSFSPSYYKSSEYKQRLLDSQKAEEKRYNDWLKSYSVLSPSFNKSQSMFDKLGLTKAMGDFKSFLGNFSIDKLLEKSVKVLSKRKSNKENPFDISFLDEYDKKVITGKGLLAVARERYGNEADLKRINDKLSNKNLSSELAGYKYSALLNKSSFPYKNNNLQNAKKEGTAEGKVQGEARAEAETKTYAQRKQDQNNKERSKLEEKIKSKTNLDDNWFYGMHEAVNTHDIKKLTDLENQFIVNGGNLKDLTKYEHTMASQAWIRMIGNASIRQMEDILKTEAGLGANNFNDLFGMMMYGGFRNPMMMGRQVFSSLSKSIAQGAIDKHIKNSDQFKEFAKLNKNATVKDFKFKDANNYELALNGILKNESAMSAISSAGLKAIPWALAAAGLLKLGKAVKDFAVDSVKAYEGIQQLQTRLSVVYSSDTEARASFNEIEAYAKKSPFGIETMTQQAILLKQSGVAGSQLMDTMKRIGDVASGNAEKMRSVSETYARIMSSTTVTARDMRQLANAGVPAYSALVASMKKNGAAAYGFDVSRSASINASEVRGMLQSGKVKSEDFKLMLKELTNKGGMFYGATERGAKTLAARKQNLDDMRQMAKATIGEYLTNVGGLADKSWYKDLITIKEYLWQVAENTSREKNNKRDASDYQSSSEIANYFNKLANNERYSETERKEFKLLSEKYDSYANSYYDKKIAAESQKYDELLELNNRTVISDTEKVRQNIVNVLGKSGAFIGSAFSGIYDLLGMNSMASFTRTNSAVTNERIKALSESTINQTAYTSNENKMKELEISKGLDEFSKSLSRGADAINDFVNASNGAQARMQNARSTYESSSYMQMVRADEEYAKNAELAGTIKNKYLSIPEFYKNGKIYEATISKISDAVLLDELLNTGTSSLKINATDLYTPTGIKESAKENWDEYYWNLTAINGNIGRDRDFKNSSVEALLGEDIGKFLGVAGRVSAAISSGDVNKLKYEFEGANNNENFILQRTSLTKKLTEAEKDYQVALDDAIKSGDADKIAENRKNIELVKGIATLFERAGSERNYSLDGVPFLNKRSSAYLRHSVMGNFLGLDPLRMRQMEEQHGWGRNATFNKYYANNGAQRQVINTVMTTLLSSGYAMNEIGKAFEGKIAGSYGIFNYDLNKTQGNLIDLAMSGNADIRHSVADSFKNQLNQINQLLSSGVITKDTIENIQQSAQALGLAFDYTVDAEGKFTDKLMESVNKLRRETQSKLLNTELTNIAKDSIENVRKEISSTTTKMNLLKLGNMTSGVSAYDIYSNIDKADGLVQQLKTKLEESNFAGVGDIIKNNTQALSLIKKIGGSNAIDYRYFTILDLLNPNMSTSKWIELMGKQGWSEQDIKEIYDNYHETNPGIVKQSSDESEVYKKGISEYKRNNSFETNSKMGRTNEVITESVDKALFEIKNNNNLTDLQKQQYYQLIMMISGANGALKEYIDTINESSKSTRELNKQMDAFSLDKKIREIARNIGVTTVNSTDDEGDGTLNSKKSRKYRTKWNTSFDKMYLNKLGLDEDLRIGEVNKLTSLPLTNFFNETRLTKANMNPIDFEFSGAKYWDVNNKTLNKELKKKFDNQDQSLIRENYNRIRGYKNQFLLQGNDKEEKLAFMATQDKEFTQNLKDYLSVTGASGVLKAINSVKNENGNTKYKKSSEVYKTTEEFLSSLFENGKYVGSDSDALRILNIMNTTGATTEWSSSLDKSIISAEILKEKFDELGVTMRDTFNKSIFDGFLSGMNDWGKVTYKVANGLETQEEAEKEMKKNAEALGAELLNQVSTTVALTGLDIARAGALSQNWGAVAGGLMMAAAGGVGKFAAGYLDASANNNNSDDDKIQRIEKLKDNLADLIEQARNDAEYYETTLRSKSAISYNEAMTATKVNDMILTPQGNFSTSPQDYLIATKNPGSLSAQPNVSFSIVNNGQPVNIESTRQTNTGDGIDFQVVINSAVKQAMNDGDYDDTFRNIQMREQGRTVSA